MHMKPLRTKSTERLKRFQNVATDLFPTTSFLQIPPPFACVWGTRGAGAPGPEMLSRHSRLRGPTALGERLGRHVFAWSVPVNLTNVPLWVCVLMFREIGIIPQNIVLGPDVFSYLISLHNTCFIPPSCPLPQLPPPQPASPLGPLQARKPRPAS